MPAGDVTGDGDWRSLFWQTHDRWLAHTYYLERNRCPRTTTFPSRGSCAAPSRRRAFAALAFALALVGSAGCKAVEFSSTTAGEFDRPVAVQFGYWSHEDLSLYAVPDPNDNADADANVMHYLVASCSRYSDDVHVDPTWKAARAFTVLPLVGLSLLLLRSGVCKSNGIVEDVVDSAAGGDLTFQETCAISSGVKFIVSAIVFWFLAAFASLDACRAAKREEGEDPPSETLIRAFL
ncbi:hypothetical protein ACHAWF_012214 [Thalassiosira exigua]